jgi:hypothetical protein
MHSPGKILNLIRSKGGAAALIGDWGRAIPLGSPAKRRNPATLIGSLLPVCFYFSEARSVLTLTPVASGSFGPLEVGQAFCGLMPV